MICGYKRRGCTCCRHNLNAQAMSTAEAKDLYESFDCIAWEKLAPLRGTGNELLRKYRGEIITRIQDGVRAGGDVLIACASWPAWVKLALLTELEKLYPLTVCGTPADPPERYTLCEKFSAHICPPKGYFAPPKYTE
jgi:hypothetical protein